MLRRSDASRRRRCAGPLIGALALALAVPATAERTLTLDDAIRIAREKNPALALARAEEERASAATVTAGQYANPSMTGFAGSMDARGDGDVEGTIWGVELQQPLLAPFTRSSRRSAAEAGLGAARASASAADAELVALVTRSFSDLHRAQSLRALADEQLVLLSRMRRAIERTVEVGEGAALDLARAETEVLNARRDVATTRAFASQAQLAMRSALGEPRSEPIAVEGTLPPLQLPPRTELLANLAEANPRIAAARLELERAHHQLELEGHRRLDGMGLAAEFGREPDNQRLLVGLRIPLPVWNRRGGEIAEARAGVSRARALLAQRELTVERELESLYNRYELAREQVELIEQGLLTEAGRALRGAEVAYRSGERGILEYLDAQRTLRDIRLDLLNARGAMERAGVEIERLAGVIK